MRCEVYVILDRCKGCNLCIHFCPQHILVESEKVNKRGCHYPELLKGSNKKCTGCGNCDLFCPDFAIFIKKIKD